MWSHWSLARSKTSIMMTLMIIRALWPQIGNCPEKKIRKCITYLLTCGFAAGKMGAGRKGENATGQKLSKLSPLRGVIHLIKIVKN